MAALSAATAKRADPNLHITALVPTDEGLPDCPAAQVLSELADDLRLVQPLHRKSGYFPDNKRHLALVQADRIVFADADTIVFGSLTALAAKFASFDVAARPSDWVWAAGYRREFAPDLGSPVNGGLVVMSRCFCLEWAARCPDRHMTLATDERRGELVRWMASVSPQLWHREEFALSEEIWSGRWSVGLMSQSDCYLLSRWPEEDDAHGWSSACVLHTYGALWNRCLARLVESDLLPIEWPAMLGPNPAPARATGPTRAELDGRCTDEWLRWVAAELFRGRPREAVVAVMVERGFPQWYASERVHGVAADPIFVGAAYAGRQQRKLASILDVQRELMLHVGFQLQRLRVDPDEFRDRYLLSSLPVVVTGLIDHWPALARWSPQYLAERYGDISVEISHRRESDPNYEANYEQLTATVSLRRFVEMVNAGGTSNDYYLTARNQALAKTELRGLLSDLGPIEGYLVDAPNDPPRLWFGPAGTVTPLHVDARGVLFAQIHGRKRFKLIAPCFTRWLYNDDRCFSSVDLSHSIDFNRYPLMRDVPILETMLEPGDVLFIPITWWHWVEAVDVSISLSFTNLIRNEPPLGWLESGQ